MMVKLSLVYGASRQFDLLRRKGLERENNENEKLKKMMHLIVVLYVQLPPLFASQELPCPTVVPQSTFPPMRQQGQEGLQWTYS